jgi:hypothetical protein
MATYFQGFNDFGQSRYYAACFCAEYYRWKASKGFPLTGNNPLNGRKRSIHNPIDSAEGVAANKALARFYLMRARDLRLKSLPPRWPS